MPSVLKRSRRAGLALAAAVSSLALAVPAAHAGTLVASAPSCDTQVLVQPFVPWLDPASYVITPGGSFEPGVASWALSGGAATTAGNEIWNVTSSLDANSLALPPGSSATSATMCVGIGHPDVRLFVKRTGGTSLSTLRAAVLFQDAYGNTQTLTIGHITDNVAGWALTPQMLIVANLLPLLPGNMTPVEFTFTPEDSASWQIDDVYVDPWRGS